MDLLLPRDSVANEGFESKSSTDRLVVLVNIWICHRPLGPKGYIMDSITQNEKSESSMDSAVDKKKCRRSITSSIAAAKASIRKVSSIMSSITTQNG